MRLIIVSDGLAGNKGGGTPSWIMTSLFALGGKTCKAVGNPVALSQSTPHALHFDKSAENRNCKRLRLLMRHYASQKAYEAASATRAGVSLDRGLKSAANSLSSFPVDEVPDRIKRRYWRIHDQLTIAPDQTGDGTIEAAITLLPKAAKQRLVEEILYLYGDVRAWEGHRDTSSDEYKNSGLAFRRTEAEKWQYLDWCLSGKESKVIRERYVKFARSYLPHFPDDILLEWIGRHTADALGDWAHLGVEQLRFEKVQWRNEQIAEIKPRDKSWTAIGSGSHGASFLDAPEQNWLAKYMLKHGTWPVPIIVLMHQDTVQDSCGERLPGPNVLVEGHRRLAYLLNLISRHQARELHSIWLAHLNDEGK